MKTLLQRWSFAVLAAACATHADGADHRIDLPSGWFTPAAKTAATETSSDTGVYVVQFDGPVTDARLDVVRRAGATPFQYIHSDAYLVVADAKAGAALAQAARNGVLRYAAPLAAEQKIAPGATQRLARNDAGLARFTVVVAEHPGMAQTQRRIRALDTTTDRPHWADLRGMQSIDVEIPVARIVDIAALPDVLAIDATPTRRAYDEKQTQTIAGHLDATRTAPSGPGYRAWLESLGFSTDSGDYPPLAIFDDGIGNGSTVAGAGDRTLTQNGENLVSRVVHAVSCVPEATPSSRFGHGHLQASIAAGYDDRSGFPWRDPEGFRRAEGVNPWLRLSMFQWNEIQAGPGCGDTYAGLIALQARQGARISSNSWGEETWTLDEMPYNATSRTFDLGTRDADPETAGNQPLLFVFAVGNSSGPKRVSAPANAKNTLGVGASENHRPSDENGPWSGPDPDMCDFVTPSTADNVMDVAWFSSRGPVVGGRAKPDLIAPGSRVQGTVSTTPDHLLPACQEYRPAGQTELTSSFGTSFATPAVAGAATLVYRWLQTHHAVATPSPALVKSTLMAFTTYLTGMDANDTLPSPNQGYGMPNLGEAFDATTSTVIIDQTHVFGAPDETFELRAVAGDNDKPVRVVLSWTDAPGAVNAQSPGVNDLDLVVTVGGLTYRGNRFSGRWSIPGGDADHVNNTEAVYLPPGTSGAITVRVVAANIAGDGVPGNDDATDQDFALVCTNCSQAPDFYVGGLPAAQTGCGANPVAWPIDVGAFGSYAGNVALSASDLPPGTSAGAFNPASGAAPFLATYSLTPDPVALTQGAYALKIHGTDATHTKDGTLVLRYSPRPAASPAQTAPADAAIEVELSPRLTWDASPDAIDYTVEVADDPAFASIERTVTTTRTDWTVTPALDGAKRYWWRVRANNHCGPGASPTVRTFTTQARFCAVPGTAIPDGGSVTLRIDVPPLGTLGDLDVAFETNHTWTGDLSLRLSKGTRHALLMDRPDEPWIRGGCGGSNANLVFDDEAAPASAERHCQSGTVAYFPRGGRFMPNEPLGTFIGEPAGGTWEVTISDAALRYTGEVRMLCLMPSTFAEMQDGIFADGFDR